MKNAAIYCRVSTEDQEKEGTSLQTQLEACRNYCKDEGYNTAYHFNETYSGLNLERPKLNELRELIRNEQIDAVVVYCLDRLSRDPVHFIILQEEFQRAGVQIILVTETLDSSDLGLLITHIKGYAAKLEAQKIRERTMMGRRTRVERDGKLPTGRGVIYGYTYDKKQGKNIADRTLDIVRMAGMWLVEEGISLNEVCRRLMKMGIPAPKGGTRWSRAAIGRILRNPTYAGKTIVFRTITKNGKRVSSSEDEQVEIANAVDRVAFTWDEWLIIQSQLDRNRELSPRNQKLSYLLRGMVYCKRDGHKYHGTPMHGYPYYRCSGRNKLLSPEPCDNRSVNARWLEENVWLEVVKVLRNPELIIAELQRRRESGADVDHLEKRMKLNRNKLVTIDEAETRYLRLYGAGVIPYEKLKNECTRISIERERIVRENSELESSISEARELVFDDKRIGMVLKSATENLANLNFKEKRLVLEALNIKVWIDGSSVELQGTIPIPEVDIVSQPL